MGLWEIHDFEWYERDHQGGYSQIIMYGQPWFLIILVAFPWQWDSIYVTNWPWPEELDVWIWDCRLLASQGAIHKLYYENCSFTTEERAIGHDVLMTSL